MKSILVILSLSFFMISMRAYAEKESKMNKNNAVETPDFSKVEIIEIRMEFREGPHKPERISVTYKSGEDTAKIIYGGLMVYPKNAELEEQVRMAIQKDGDPNSITARSTSKKKPYWGREPGSKTISKKDWERIVALVRECKTWGKPDSGLHFMKIITYDKNASLFRKKNTIESVPENSNRISQLLGNLYGEPGILQPAMWD